MMIKPSDSSEMSELISVIIPIYNVEPYLYRCLESVVNNTYKKLQIICINDGSTDRSGEILDNYAMKDHRFVVINKPNGGVSSARNVGLKEAKGEYISFVDADDWIHPQCFEILIRMIKAAESKLAISELDHTDKYRSSEPIDIEKVAWRPIEFEELFSSRSTKNYVCGKLYQKEIVKEQSFEEKVSYSEDTLFNIHVAINSPGLFAVYTEQPLYYYYNRQGSLVHTNSAKNLVSVGKEMLVLAQQADAPIVKATVLKETMKRLLSARYEMFITADSKENFKECSSLLKNCCREAFRSKSFSGTEMIKYSALSKFPHLYRIWRIRNDPTMLKWENINKEKRKNNNRN